MKAGPQLLVNRCITPDGTVLQSNNRHDFVGHTDAITGEYYFTDGGSSYIHRSVNKIPAKSADVWVDSPQEDIREFLRWGTYGKNGDQPLKYVALKDLTDEHIAAILSTQCHISSAVKTAFVQEQEYRIKHSSVNKEN